MQDREVLNNRHKRAMKAWAHLCVICGEQFRTGYCVTLEHLIPRSMGGSNDKENIAPSHYRCNMLRGVKSIIETAKLIDLRRQRLSKKEFAKWLNKKQPKREPCLRNQCKLKTKSVEPHSLTLPMQSV